MALETNRDWYLLTSKPRQDERAELQLINQGYEVYRPLAKRLRKQRGKIITTVESLFPRYMFIHLDNGINDNWMPIKSTFGVGGFVRFGMNMPTRVPDHLILGLKAQSEMLGERAIDLDRFHTGDKVVITSGPFHGLEAMFQSYDGEERVVVLLQLLNCRPSKMVLSPEQVMAA